MCCPTTQTNARAFAHMAVRGCGCGCMGHQPTKEELEKQRDHLNVELRSIEKQIQNLDQK